MVFDVNRSEFTTDRKNNEHIFKKKKPPQCNRPYNKQITVQNRRCSSDASNTLENRLSDHPVVFDVRGQVPQNMPCAYEWGRISDYG